MNNGQLIKIDAARFDIDLDGDTSNEWSYKFYGEEDVNGNEEIIASFKYDVAYGVSLATSTIIESTSLALPIFNTPLLEDNSQED